MSLQEFTLRYIETALWSSMDESDPETGGEPMDRNYGLEDIAAPALELINADCGKFYNAYLEIVPDGDDGLAGHDFWLTRNGYGAGFWDGDWPEPEASELTALSEQFGECDLYVGDDGQIWLM